LWRGKLVHTVEEWAQHLVETGERDSCLGAGPTDAQDTCADELGVAAGCGQQR
jgi:hypothetical protein